MTEDGAGMARRKMMMGAPLTVDDGRVIAALVPRIESAPVRAARRTALLFQAAGFIALLEGDFRAGSSWTALGGALMAICLAAVSAQVRLEWREHRSRTGRHVS